MLQDLVKAYGEAYTVAITQRLAYPHDREARDRDAGPETPDDGTRRRSWRTLLSAFL